MSDKERVERAAVASISTTAAAVESVPTPFLLLPKTRAAADSHSAGTQKEHTRFLTEAPEG